VQHSLKPENKFFGDLLLTKMYVYKLYVHHYPNPPPTPINQEKKTFQKKNGKNPKCIRIKIYNPPPKESRRLIKPQTAPWSGEKIKVSGAPSAFFK